MLREDIILGSLANTKALGYVKTTTKSKACMRSGGGLHIGEVVLEVDFAQKMEARRDDFAYAGDLARQLKKQKGEFAWEKTKAAAYVD